MSFPTTNFRKSDAVSSARVFRVSESFDLPNILAPGAETGNLAYFNDQVWYKAVSGWTPVSTGGGGGGGNTIVSGNLITSSGNLVINPAGTSTDFSGKDVGNINVLTVQTLNSGNIFNSSSIQISPSASSGTFLTLGNTNGASVTNPISINMGGSYSSIPGTNPKLRVYSDGVSSYGIGASLSSMDYSVPMSTESHNFYISGLNRLSITNTSVDSSVAVRTSEIGTAAGDLSIFPFGANVNFNNKNVVNTNSVTTMTLNTANIFGGGNITISPAENLLLRPTGNVILNPVGPVVDFSGKSIINAVLPPQPSSPPTLFVGDLFQISPLDTLDAPFYNGSGILKGSLSIPPSELAAVGDGLVFTTRLRIIYGAPGDFVLTINLPDAPIIKTFTGVAGTVYDYRIELNAFLSTLLGGVGGSRIFSYDATFVPTSSTSGFLDPVVSVSTVILGPGENFNIPLSGRYTVANSSNQAVIGLTEIRKV